MHKHWIVAALVVTCLLSSGTAHGEILLNDLNSTLTLDSTFESPITSWTVEGVEQLYHHWWWLSTSTLDPMSLNYLNSTGEYVDSNSVTWSYEDDDETFDAVVTIGLAGGANGSRNSTIRQTLSLTNLTADPLSIRVFALSDLDLGGVADPNSVSFMTSQWARQTSPDGWRTDETVDLAPSVYAAGYAPNIYDAITYDGSLSTAAGPFSGDVEYGFQWDLVLGAYESMSISRGVSTVPEPASLVILASMASAGSLAFWWRHRVRRSRTTL